MVGVNVFAADTDAEARRLFTSLQQAFITCSADARGPLPPPIDDIETYWSPAEKPHASMLACSFVGAPETVRQELQALSRRPGGRADGQCGVFDHAAKLRSYELLAKEIAPSLAKEPASA